VVREIPSADPVRLCQCLPISNGYQGRRAPDLVAADRLRAVFRPDLGDEQVSGMFAGQAFHRLPQIAGGVVTEKYENDRETGSQYPVDALVVGRDRGVKRASQKNLQIRTSQI
jgi:hypothetical protein